MAKTDALTHTIKQCNEFIENVMSEYPNVDKCRIENFVYRIVNVYINEIPNISYCINNKDFDFQEDMEDSLSTLIAMLSQYKDNVENAMELSVEKSSNIPNININTTQTSHQSQSVEISNTLKPAIDIIQQIPSSVLDEDEKDVLITKLGRLEKIASIPKQDKDKIWSKVKEILVWIADKSVNAGIQLLPTIPYVVRVMEMIK